MYEVDPLLCSFCGAEMKILAFILDFGAATAIRKSLELPDQEPEPLVRDDAEVESLSGLETWFVVPGRSQGAPPPRWEQALLTALGVYPLLLVLNLTLVPRLGDLALPIRLVVVLVVGIPILNWVIMPWLSRLFFRWLYGTD